MNFRSVCFLGAAETIRQLALLRRYLFSSTTEMLTEMLLLAGLLYSSDRSPATFVSLITWRVAAKRVGQLSQDLKLERRHGTLPQIYLSGTDMTAVVLARTVTSLIIDLIKVLLSALPAALLVSSKIDNPNWGVTLISLLMGLLGLAGLAFALAGVSVLWRQIGTVSFALEYLLLLWSGVFMPAKEAGVLRWARFLPLTDAMSCIRDSVMERWSTARLLQSHLFWRGLGVGTVYLVVGFVVFRLIERHARLSGSLFTQ